MSYKTIELHSGTDDEGRRLDRIIRKILPDLALSSVYKMIRNGDIKVDGKKTKADFILEKGNTIKLRIPESMEALLAVSSPIFKDLDKQKEEAYKKNFEEIIIKETSDIVFVNKPRGMLTHGDEGLDILAKCYFADKRKNALAFTPAPLHRLDRNTTGIVSVSSSQKGAKSFSNALKEHSIKKIYLALLGLDIKEKQTWKDNLERDEDTMITCSNEDGKIAECEVFPLLNNGKYTVAAIHLITGRTHQIRAQAALHFGALPGDKKYGEEKLPQGYLLHCAYMEIPENIVSQEKLIIKAPIPIAWKENIEFLFGKDSFDALKEKFNSFLE